MFPNGFSGLLFAMGNPTQMVPTKASQLKNQTHVDVVVFSRNKKSAPKSSKPEAKAATNEPEFDVKRATKDIIRMGSKGFYKFKREKTLKSLAIELGAKPEKPRGRNYKVLKEIRKVQKERRDQRINMLKESSNLSSINHFKRKYAKKNEKKKDFDILNSYGKAK